MSDYKLSLHLQELEAESIVVVIREVAAEFRESCYLYSIREGFFRDGPSGREGFRSG